MSINAQAMPTALHAGDPRVNATVSASAGTGKTWLLVTRMIRLLLAGARPEGLLAITFTRKAAAEMQSRLRERLLALAGADDARIQALLIQMGVAPDAETIGIARRLYETLLRAPTPPRTTTFHAFCQDVLRRFPLEADVIPGFDLLDATRAVEREALAALYAEATAAPNGACARALETLFDAVGGTGTDQALLQLLAHRSDWWAYTAGAADPVGAAGNHARELLRVDPTRAIEHEFDRSQRAYVGEFARLLETHPTKTNLAFAAQLTATAGSDDALRRFDAIKSVFLRQDNTPRARESSKALEGALGSAGQTRFLELHHLVCAALLEALDAQRARRTWQLTTAWQAAGQRLIEHYQRIKQERRLLDFNDLEWKTCELLNASDNAHWVQYKLDQRIDHLLVDEFQDTNPVQWRMLLPLLHEMASGGERARSVFLVGDDKQSIYRFRRADPRLFTAARAWLAGNLNAQSFALDESRRSAQAVIDCVNLVFQQDDVRDAFPDFPRHATHHAKLLGQVEVLELTEDVPPGDAETADGLRNPLQQPRRVYEDVRYDREGAAIAERIKALVENNTLIGAAADARPLRYGDVMILLRNRTHVRAYENALRVAAIPYVGADRGTLLENLEVRDVIALLEWLVAPFDNLALATVLRSPLFACSDADLMLLAGAGPAGGWMERLAALAPQCAELHPLRRAHRWLSQWRAAAGTLPVHDLLDRIYADGRMLERYAAAAPTHLRTRVVANLTRLLELALELDSGRYPSLGHFVARLRDARAGVEDAPDEGVAAGAHDCVRVLTIHAAKGLESPVVFLADAATAPRPSRGYRVLLDWSPQRAQPDCFLLTGKKEDRDSYSSRIIDEQERAERREELNLLYVALTRARQFLFISGSNPKRSRNLHWYGLVRDALAAHLGANVPLRLESGEVPVTPREAPVHDINAPVTVDPRLQRPSSPPASVREIAPSHGAGVAAGADTDVDAQARGVAIHRVLDGITRAAEVDAQTLRRSIAAQLQRDPDDAQLQLWWTEAEAVVREPALRAWFDASLFESAYNEVPVVFGAGDATVHGVIDRVVLTADEAVIIDYKSHHQANPVNLADLAAGYREQMRWYVAGARRLWPRRRVRAFLLFTACRAALEVALDEPG
jgi:ATP-dependent helicase/nuclease subunit A